MKFRVTIMSLSLFNKRIMPFVLIAVIALSAILVDISSKNAKGAAVEEQELVTSGANTELVESSASFSNKYSVQATANFNMRKGAGNSYDVIKTIKKGTTLYITQNSSGYWVKAKLSDNTQGYIPTKYLNKVSGSSITMRCRTTDNVNLRKGAGTSYSVITVVPKNTALSTQSNANLNWVKVSYNGNSGYISKSYSVMVFTIPQSTNIDKNAPLSLKYSSVSMYKNNYFQIPAVNNTKETIKWSTSNSSVASITSDGIIYGNKAGTVTIKAKVSKKTVSCKLKVLNMSRSVNISNKKYTANSGKTIYLTSSTSGASWSSSDSSVARVNNGLVECKGTGKAVIYVKVSGGWATCLVTVKGKEAVRFTYANPNSAPLNSNVTFIAITDKYRTGVKFVVSRGSIKFTIKASSKSASGNTYVWKATKKLTKAGAYKVVAYSLYKNKWYKSTGSYGNAYVTKATSNTAVSCEERHASNKIISFISNYEGFLSSAIYDPLTNFPCLTVGYGRVIYAGETFYNNMTKNEAFAYLVDSVENDGYVSKVNRFLLDNKIMFNQQQFDSLVSFVYNCGTGTLTNDSDLQYLLFNTYPSTEKNPTKGKITSKCGMRKGAGGAYDTIKTLKAGTKVTLLSASLYNKAWYRVKDSSGKTGYISYKALSITSYNKGGTRNLNNTIKQNYINNFFCYHHAGGVCYEGLLYRRIDECEIFYHGEYTRNGSENKNNFYFRCFAHNPGFGCG